MERRIEDLECARKDAEDNQKEAEKLIQDMEKKLENAMETIEKLKCPQKKNQTEVPIPSLSKTPQELPPAKSERNIALDEVEDRERRKCNLVFYGLPESEQETPKDRVEDDKAGIRKTLEKVEIQFKPDEIITIFRAGKKSDRPRPVVVKLRSKELRDEIISKGKKIKIATHITASPDLTNIQRQNLSSLYTEAAEKNQTESENYEWKVVGPRDLPSLVRRAKKN